MAIESVEQEKEAVGRAVAEQATLVPYKPISVCKPLGSLVPISLAAETVGALDRVKQQYGDVVEFVAEELGYQSRIDVCLNEKGEGRFGAEQIDAVASIIHQFKNNNGYILADMAVIGKGRICAAIVRYAFQQGKIPVFMTIAPTLFSDMYRDIMDIGGLRSGDDESYFGNPFILNGAKSDDSTSVIDSRDRVVVKPITTRAVGKILRTQKFPKEYNWMMSTYSQLSHDRTGAKTAFFEAIAEDCIFILDEAHVIAGASSLGDTFEVLVQSCNNVLFSSATFAKRPENMKIFSHRTDLGKSNIGVRTLLEAIDEGGTKLQEYMAATLVKSGK